MNVYIYQAALYCEPCSAKIASSINTSAIATGSCSVDDSDFYPQGPYPDGGGESDSPQHCDSCNVFLRNPLTSDGYAYVREQLRLAPPHTLAGSGVVALWAEFYGIEAIDDARDGGTPQGD